MALIKLKDDFSNSVVFDNEIKLRGFYPLWKKFLKDIYNGIDYPELSKYQKLFEPYGLTFDYYLDAEPFDFELI